MNGPNDEYAGRGWAGVPEQGQLPWDASVIATVTRHVTRFAALLTVVAATLGGVPGARAAAQPPAGVPALAGSAKQDAYEAQVLRLTNKARSRARTCGGKRMRAVGPVSWSDTLATSANGHSSDMAANDYFSHDGRDGRTPFARIRAAGYEYRFAGENIAAGRRLSKPRAVVKAWLRSPGHCRVIMNPDYRELGVARVAGPGKYRVYWTQNFGAGL